MPETPAKPTKASRQKSAAELLASAEKPRSPRPRRRKVDLDVVLAEAARMFDERGYRNTGIDDIGAAIGVTGPALYHHFKRKDDLLRALVTKALGLWEETMAHPLDPDEDPRTALEVILRRQIHMYLSERHLMSIAAKELLDTPADEKRQYQRTVRKIREQSMDLLTQLRPDMSETECRLTLHVVSGMLTTLTSVDPSIRRSVVEDRMVSMLLAVMMAS